MFEISIWGGLELCLGGWAHQRPPWRRDCNSSEPVMRLDYQVAPPTLRVGSALVRSRIVTKKSSIRGFYVYAGRLDILKIAKISTDSQWFIFQFGELSSRPIVSLGLKIWGSKKYFRMARFLFLLYILIRTVQNIAKFGGTQKRLGEFSSCLQGC